MPLAEHDAAVEKAESPIEVSIHVPLAEHDGARPDIALSWYRAKAFQFTCPSRSTTKGAKIDHAHHKVSIHVPLAEHDVTVLQ